MTLFNSLVPILYQLAGILLSIYGCFVFASVLLFLRHRGNHDWLADSTGHVHEWPAVTIQVPIYNEPLVARRVVEAVAALRYPADKLQIQILDDSTDHTSAMLTGLITQLQQEQGLNISYLHRHDRSGFKAGALAQALPQATGDFIAIFDADFAPQPDWLQRTLPSLLANPQLAFVQTRWGHINRRQNPLTAAQGLALDGHFVIEQQARSASGFLQNFNGSGGIWRKVAIEAAGGWTSDTVTEDLDLSYRAQLAGWRGAYLNRVEAPAEVPPLVFSFKRQQRRWAKGSAQTLRKLARPILTSNYALPKRFYALAHLAGYATHLPLLSLLFLTLPLALLPVHTLPLPFIGYISLILSIAPMVMYTLSQHQMASWMGLSRLWVLPILALLSLGLSPMMGHAVWEGLWKRGGDFERTPKQGTGSRSMALPSGMSWRGLVPEAVTLLYALVTVLVIVITRQWQLAPLPILYSLGCALVLFLGISEYSMAKTKKDKPQRYAQAFHSSDPVSN